MQLKNYKQTSWLQPLLYENGLRNCMDWAEVGAPGLRRGRGLAVGQVADFGMERGVPGGEGGGSGSEEGFDDAVSGRRQIDGALAE